MNSAARVSLAAMPTNLYGPEDNFALASSHVVPALIAKMHHAKVTGAAAVEIWGTGRPRREFLYVDDLADALVFLMQHYSDESHVNVGCGSDLAIGELAQRVAAVVGFRGDFTSVADKPDGAPRKLLDVGRMTALGWTAPTSLDEGLRRTYEWYLEHVATTAL